VEDNPGDVRLTLEAMKEGRVLNRISVVEDGIEAMAFLNREGRYADSPVPTSSFSTSISRERTAGRFWRLSRRTRG